MSYEIIPQFLLNYIFVSMPQNMLIMLLVIFLTKEYEYFTKENFKKTCLDLFFIVVLPSAFFMNYLYYSVDMNIYVRMAFNTLMLISFMLFFIRYNLKKKLYSVYKQAVDISSFNSQFRRESKNYIYTVQNNKEKLRYKRTLRLFFSSILLAIIIHVLEVSISLYLQYVFNFDITGMRVSTFDSILFICPQLVILSFMIYLGYVYVNTQSTTLLGIWRRNKKFRVLTYIQIFTTFSFVVVIYNFLVKSNLLNSLSQSLVFKMAIGLYLLLILHVLVPWIVVCRKEVNKFRIRRNNKNLS